MRIRPNEARVDSATPESAARLGGYTALLFSDTGGLTQFGAFVETLEPGAQSSDRHWHETEDEFLLMLEGRAVLVEDGGEFPLEPGDACTWKAGEPNGHTVMNRSGAPCSYLVVGTRNADDVVHYSDLDKVLHREGGRRRLTRRDGSPFE